MKINAKQILIIIIFITITFIPVNKEIQETNEQLRNYFLKGGKIEYLKVDKKFDGYRFIVTVLNQNENWEGYGQLVREIYKINYPLLAFEFIVIASIFLFYVAGKFGKKVESTTKFKLTTKSKSNPVVFFSNIFHKIFNYVKEQNRRSLFWATIAILTIAIYILEFFTGVSKLLLSLF